MASGEGELPAAGPQQALGTYWGSHRHSARGSGPAPRPGDEARPLWPERGAGPWDGDWAAPRTGGAGGLSAADGEAAELCQAVAEERARIARDLHDSVDKSLHGIALAASSLAASVTAEDGHARTESLRSSLRELAGLALYAISETRCVIYDLRDETYLAPLGEVVWNLVMQWSAGSGVPVDIAVPPAIDAADSSRREIIAILREALRNVERHAHATRVRVSLRTYAGRLLLTISDNGSGCALPADPEDMRDAARYGLIGMTERARKLGGALVIRSRPGNGTRIAAQVPAACPDVAR